ncbi:MAG: cytochrome c3 family protein [Deltaproteobacteria bacterium]|nr:cytochrome c3 family protein [Deltaproteobacteria bacterium]
MARTEQRTSGRLIAVAGALLATAVLALLATNRVAKAGEHVVSTRFAGAEGCRACHPTAYQKWRNSAHARALAGLGERERADPKCRQCHTTDPEESDAALAGVQCEACHGPGRYYSLDYVMRDQELRELLGFRQTDEKACLRCHTESTPSIRPFVYQEKYELIRHDEPESAAKPSQG